MMQMQAMVNGDLPGMRQLQYTTNGGGSYTTITALGWRPFKEYLQFFSDSLPGAWAVSYSETSDRVVFSPGSGTLGVKFETQSMADLWGNASTTVAGGSSEFTLDSAPMGICPISHLHVGDPVSNKRPRLQQYRHGRMHSTAFGGGVEYSVEIKTPFENQDRILGGPLSSGKLRLGDYSAGAVYSASNLSGYLDICLLSQDDIAAENIEVENTFRMRFKGIAPRAAHSSTDDPTDTFWGHLERGHSINYYAEIEGVPFRFTEAATGLPTGGSRTESATLVIDQSQRVRHKMDRFKGISGASGILIGVLDPENALNFFGRPSVQIPILSSFAYDGTSIFLKETPSDLPASGFVFLGKECIYYGSKDDSTKRLTSLAFNYGPRYSYDLNTIQAFSTVCNRKRVWDGCLVTLGALLIDPFGRPVDAAWNQTYYREVFKGEVSGIPGYSSGVWTIRCRDLMRRLAKGMSQGASGKTLASIQDSAKVQPSAAAAGAQLAGAAGTLVSVRSQYEEVKVRIEYSWPGDFSHPPGEDVATSIWTIGTDPKVGVGLHQYGVIVNQLCQFIAGIAVTNAYTTGGSASTAGAQCMVWPEYNQFQLTENGQVLAALKYKHLNKNGLSAGMDMYIDRIEIQGLPYWISSAPGLFDLEFLSGLDWLGGSGTYWTFFDRAAAKNSDFTTQLIYTGLYGKQTHTIVVKQDPQAGPHSGSFPSSGHAVLKGPEDQNELISYANTVALTDGSGLALTDCYRAIEGQPVNVFSGDVEVIQGAFLQGSGGSAYGLGANLAAVLESSGTAGLRGSFDVLPLGFGYGLTAADYIHDAQTGGDGAETALTNALNPQLAPVELVYSGGQSFAEFFGGLLSSYHYCLAWVRSGKKLKMGLCGTINAGSVESYTITDSDLLAGNSISVAEVGSGPNSVTVNQASSMLGKGGRGYTYRIIEDMQARGTFHKTFDLYGLEDAEWLNQAVNLAISMVNTSSTEVAYKMKLRPSRDYLAGQLVRFNITSPQVFDWKTSSLGLTGIGRIMEVTRSLVSGEVEITVLTGATVLLAPLCPVAIYASHTVNTDGNTVVTVSDSSIFSANDPVRFYNPGANVAEEKQIISVDFTAPNTFIFTGTFGITPAAGYTVCTYPLSSNGAITAKQDAHVHFGDGSQYL